MYFVQKSSRNSMDAILFKFDAFNTDTFQIFFKFDAFNTDTFQHAILYLFKRKVIHVSYPLSGDMVILCVGQIELELWSIL